MGGEFKNGICGSSLCYSARRLTLRLSRVRVFASDRLAAIVALVMELRHKKPKRAARFYVTTHLKQF
jgi:hypothetical protein